MMMSNSQKHPKITQETGRLKCNWVLLLILRHDFARVGGTGNSRAAMTQQQTDIDYDRIERAINYIAKHLHDQPSLEQIAAAGPGSPYHFQRMFLKWAGVSPKKIYPVSVA